MKHQTKKNIADIIKKNKTINNFCSKIFKYHKKITLTSENRWVNNYQEIIHCPNSNPLPKFSSPLPRMTLITYYFLNPVKSIHTLPTFNNFLLNQRKSNKTKLITKTWTQKIKFNVNLISDTLERSWLKSMRKRMKQKMNALIKIVRKKWKQLIQYLKFNT